MIGAIDTATITITISGIELLALKKLSLVSHALAQKLGSEASREQKCLASTLDDLIRQIELQVHSTGAQGKISEAQVNAAGEVIYRKLAVGIELARSIARDALEAALSGKEE